MRKLKNMVVGIDFDGTVVEHVYPYIGQDAPHSIRVMKRLVENDYKLILFTMRGGQQLDEAVQWFWKNGIELYGIQKNPDQHLWTDSPKCYCDCYIDDAAFGAPLTLPDGFNRECINWLEVESAFFPE